MLESESRHAREFERCHTIFITNTCGNDEGMTKVIPESFRYSLSRVAYPVTSAKGQPCIGVVTGRSRDRLSSSTRSEGTALYKIDSEARGITSTRMHARDNDTQGETLIGEARLARVPACTTFMDPNK